ncbi:hypothetical protein BW687_001360 [Pseudomonas graminis]|uniref:hypothetical protein n=1 Tax=Pseudomonas graminis TaxID=158627 RepID=UPI002349184A|nr:hypothetical protein [Pseudomonas graminis]MDC6378828.1 hypothetical protein [Pseudomonas graminis]
MTNTIEEKLLRPPYIKARAGGKEPLTVVCSFLSRSDNTPLSERTRAVGHVLDHKGEVIADPAKNPEANAFEGTPNVNFEHYGEYWRKVHGVRFIHPESNDDSVTLEKLVRYDQLHRLAAGPTQTDTPPYQVPADGEGKLWPTVIGKISPYHRPQWDGIAYLNFSTADDISAVLSSNRVLEKIIPEEKVVFRDMAPLLSKQYVIIPSLQNNEGVTLVKIHKRQSHLSRVDFQNWWIGNFAEKIRQQNSTTQLIKRYVQLHNIGPTEAGKPFFHEYTSSIDGVSLLSFASLSDLEDYLRSPATQELFRVEATECQSTEYWTAVGVVLVNRIHPECETSVSEQ